MLYQSPDDASNCGCSVAGFFGDGKRVGGGNFVKHSTERCVPNGMQDGGKRFVFYRGGAFLAECTPLADTPLLPIRLPFRYAPSR